MEMRKFKLNNVIKVTNNPVKADKLLNLGFEEVQKAPEPKDAPPTAEEALEERGSEVLDEAKSLEDYTKDELQAYLDSKKITYDKKANKDVLIKLATDSEAAETIKEVDRGVRD